MSYSIDDPSNLRGISSFINSEAVKPDVIAQDVEKEMTSSEKKSIDYEKISEDEMKKLYKDYGISKKQCIKLRTVL